MRYLGMDLGTKTLGMAISDGVIATYYKTLRFEFENYESILDELKFIIQNEGIDIIVIGLPKNMNGTIGFAGERTYNFCSLLKKIFTKKIILQDERLSSVSANNMLVDANISRKKRKKAVDGVAAIIILQQYLDVENRRNQDGK